jgi:hypothetical protein
MIKNFIKSGMEVLLEITKVVRNSISTHVKQEIRDLEHLHEFICDSDLVVLQLEASRAIWTSDLAYELALSEKEKISEIVGDDIDIQSYPHLRIARPNSSNDNVGFHRDIDYGGSVFELSMWIPLTNAPVGSGMYLLPDSLGMGYDGFRKKIAVTDSPKGSARNLVGFPYSMNNVILNKEQKENLRHQTMEFGQYLTIPLMMVHGSELNTSAITRLSIDMRFCSPFVHDERSTLNKRRAEQSSNEAGDVRYPYYRKLTRSNFGAKIDAFREIK